MTSPAEPVGAVSADLEEARDDCERWLRHQGVPHLSPDYSASRDVLTRAAPLLSLVFIGELTTSLNVRFALWQNILAFLAATAIVLLVVTVVNRARGRPALRVPDRFGWPESLGFVLVPPLLPLIFGGDVGQALLVLGGNLLLLGAVYLFLSYAVASLLRWALRLSRRLLRDIAAVMGRTLPVLLLFSVFMFLNAEMWKVIAELSLPFYAATLGLFVALGTAYALLRLPQEVDGLSTFGSWAEVRQLSAGTPADRLGVDDDGGVPRSDLDAAARRNVALVGVVGVGLQALAVSVLVAAFYVAFGLLTIDPATFEQWVGEPARLLLPPLTVLGQEVILSRELLLTAGFIGVVAGLQFVVTALTDPSFREEFLDEVRAELRRAFAVRAVYVTSVETSADGPPSAATNAS